MNNVSLTTAAPDSPALDALVTEVQSLYGEAVNAAEIQRSKKPADSKLEKEFRQIAEDLLIEAIAYISEKIEMKDPI